MGPSRFRSARVLPAVIVLAVLSVAASARAQVSEGIKPPGPRPYVELFGRKRVRPAHPRPKAIPGGPGAGATARSPHAPRPASPGAGARPVPPRLAAPVARPAPTSASPPAPRPVAPNPPRPASAVAAAPPRPAPPVVAPPHVSALPATAATARPPAAARTPPLAPPPLAPPPVAGAPIDPAALGAFVDGAVAQARVSDHAEGVAVAVVQNGQVLLERGYGLARLSPARPVDPRTTLFRLGSVSKAFTWIEVLKAVESGRLKLDAPVNDALPEPLRLPAEGFRAPVTLLELMDHSAGLEAREFGRLFVLDPARLRPPAEALRQDRPRRVRPPGELSSYSSYDAALAAAALQQATGRPFDEAVERDLFAPLGMASTSFRQPHPPDDALPAPLAPALADRLAEGHVWTNTGLSPVPFEFAELAPALSASSTADDMARFMAALLAQGRAPGSGAAVWGPATAAALLAPGPARGGRDAWTRGLMRYSLSGGRFGYGHDGATLGFRAKLMVVPALDLGVFIAADSDTGERLVRRLPEAIVSRFAPAPPSATPAPYVDAQAERARMAGLYLSTRRAYHGLEGFADRLSRLFSLRVGAAGRLVVSGPSGARVFAPTAQAGVFRSTAGPAQLRVLGAADGAARGFVDAEGVGAAERVGWLGRPATLATAAAAGLSAALLTLAGLLIRDRREYRQTSAQGRASALQTACAVLWVIAAADFVAFRHGASDPVRLYTAWPSPWLVGASWAALAASVATLGQLVQLRGVWADSRRQPGWTVGRKLRHTLTVLVFVGFGFTLAAWGALEPWSS